MGSGEGKDAAIKELFAKRSSNRMTDDGPILVPRLKGQVATPQLFRMYPSQGVSQIIGEICLTPSGFDQVDGLGLT